MVTCSSSTAAVFQHQPHQQSKMAAWTAVYPVNQWRGGRCRTHEGVCAFRRSENLKWQQMIINKCYLWWCCKYERAEISRIRRWQGAAMAQTHTRSCPAAGGPRVTSWAPRFYHLSNTLSHRSDITAGFCRQNLLCLKVYKRSSEGANACVLRSAFSTHTLH